MKIKSITCPSCGSSLNADENETRVICSFCGCSVIVEDTRQEGYNFELGSMQARANAAQELANRVDQLMGPLCDYERVASEKTMLENQKQSLLKQSQICEKFGKLIAYAIGFVLALILIVILSAAEASFVAFLIFGILTAASVFVAGFVILKYWDNVSKGAEDTEQAIDAHEKTLQNFRSIIDEHRDINIPAQFRNIQAMSFIRDNLKSQQSLTVEQAISQYESVQRQQKSLELQEEQVRLQREQLEQTKQAQKNPQANFSLFGGQTPNPQNRGTSIFGSGTQNNNNSTVVRNKKVVVKQHGHSIVFHLILCCFGIGMITIPYYTLSPRHYWHL